MKLRRGIKLTLQAIGLASSGAIGLWVLSHKASELGGTFPALVITLAASAGVILCWPRRGQ